MILYPFYFIIYLIMLCVAVVVTPLLPFFTEYRLGGINNDECRGLQPKLIKELSWFDTPDNSLWGDDAHKVRNPQYTNWLSIVIWLYRNPLYGFKWNVLGCPMWDKPVIKRTSWLYTKGWYFQLYIGKLKFGWILDAYYERVNQEPKAIFVFWS